MREEILNSFEGSEVLLEQGLGGNFIVEADGEVIFSKQDQEIDRFPVEGEIKELLEQFISKKN